MLSRYHECADCGPRGIFLDWTINDAAARFGVSPGTIKRREAEAVVAGLMRREYGLIILSPMTWEIGSQRIETAQTFHDGMAQSIGSHAVEYNGSRYERVPRHAK